jgi:uncharacterized NAD(P)/FAD-binding protein YdhS
MTDMDTLRLAIVGLGPRGLSVLERACANASVCVPFGHRLVIHVVDPHVGRGGQVWRRDQQADLLMNTVASQVSMFVDDSVDCVGPHQPGPSLYEWARFVTLVGLPDPLPDHVLAEAARLGPDSYPSRAFYGHYLSWTLSHVIRTAPATVSVELHADTVLDLRDNDDGSQRVKLAGGDTIQAHAVVLTQGHLPSRLNRAQESLRRFADDHRLRYLPPGNPADTALADIPPGEPVVLRGLGLNFFDHVALLTVGRGGSFHRRDDGTLVYLRSGNEPRLVAGSRRGVPYHARGENQKGPSGRHWPLFLTDDVIARFRHRADHGDPVNFRHDVWPLIDREVRAVYYTTLVRERGCDADAFLHWFVAIAADRVSSTSDPFEPRMSDAERKLLENFDIAPDEWWDWRDVATPCRDLPPDTAGYRAWLRAYLVRDVAQARLGNVRGAVKAAIDVLRDLRNEIRLIVDHAGLSGDSYRDDLQGWYMPLNAYLSIGPPAQRIEELVALIDSGVVEILGPQLRVQLDPDNGCFVASSSVYHDIQVPARTLIEARLPEPDLRHTTDPLLRSLLARGECRLHRIPIVGGGSYPTGGLAVTRRPYHLLDQSGHAHPRRFTFGVPTETVHWITAAGIRPGVNSVILGDADAVARASLLAARALTQLTPAEVS